MPYLGACLDSLRERSRGRGDRRRLRRTRRLAHRATATGRSRQCSRSPSRRRSPPCVPPGSSPRRRPPLRSSKTTASSASAGRVRCCAPGRSVTQSSVARFATSAPNSTRLGRLSLRVQRVPRARAARAGREPAGDECLLRPPRRFWRLPTCCATGKWESWLHGRLRERGFELYCEPDAVIEHEMDFGFRDFISQRYHYSRAYAAMRTPDLRRDAFVYFLAAPLLVPLLYCASPATSSDAADQAKLVLATPLILVYSVVTAVGEAIGYAAGAGAVFSGPVVGSESTEPDGRTGVATVASRATSSADSSRSTPRRVLRRRRRRGRRWGSSSSLVSRSHRGALSRVGRARLSPRDPRSPAAVVGSLARPARRVPVPVALYLLPGDRLPTVVGVHDTIAEDYPQLTLPTRRARTYWSAKRTLAVRRATRLFTVSEAARAALVERFGLREDRSQSSPRLPRHRFVRAMVRRSRLLSARSVFTSGRTSSLPAASARTRISRRCSMRTRSCARPEMRCRRSCSPATWTTSRTSQRPTEFGERSRRWGSGSRFDSPGSCPTRRLHACTPVRPVLCCRLWRRGSVFLPSRRQRAAPHSF